MDALKREIQHAVTTGFVDDVHSSSLEYRPTILTNDLEQNTKVLSTILEELRLCESFFLSVAFVTSGGVTSLIGTLLDLELKGVKGKILVSEYLNFTEPEALKKLLKLTNVELKIARDNDFHSKGFLFTHASYYSIIIGSSNLTQGALTKNKEWNLKVTAHKDSELFKKTIEEFNKVFSNAQPVDLEYLEKYAFAYNSEKKLRQGLRRELLKTKSDTVSPNTMQLEALSNLKNLRSQGKTKALLVSATGTGKTFLSAFDVLEVKPKRMLFLVHRRNIAQKSMDSFKKIMGSELSMGLYSGNKRDVGADYIFSTVQTFSRESHLSNFAHDDFDYIVIDESHRASASTYQKILNHFNPKFLLGMTATPERTDGFDIFNLFDYNIAYEIRLHDALEHEMLTPFHYFGISEIEINGKLLGEKASVNDLNREDRVDHIIKKADFFGTDDGIVRGLVFCSRKEECHFLSEEFNNRGYRTIALTGSSHEDERSRAIDLLETDDLEIKLDYIFSVDIFNEGVDIPRVNQIIMLRPTQSAIIFVQQLGRGLRKLEGKSYLTVIDFIGNYQNNFLVPIALFGDKSFVKDNLRKLVNRPEKSLRGASTVYFDRIVKERIYHAIDTGKLHLKRKLVEEYQSLKSKIGKVPTMMDFVRFGERDPYQYITEYKSYYTFQLDQKESLTPLNNAQKEVLFFLSKEVLNPVRFVDIHLIKTLLISGDMNVEDYLKSHLSFSNVVLEMNTLDHAISHINGGFITITENKKKVKIGLSKNFNLIKKEGDRITIGSTLRDLMKNSNVREHLIDLCEYSLKTIQSQSSEFGTNDFLINQRYSRKDVFRVLQWDENPVAQNVGGYMVSKDKSDCAIFVNYHKAEDISATTKYHDRFVSRSEFIWMSKSKRKLTSPDVSTILQQEEHTMRIPLFVKKSNLEGNDFYYLGNLQLKDDCAIEKEIPDDKGKKVSIVEFSFRLETPVEIELYDYLVLSD